MILISGAAGKTGQAVTRALARRGVAVRALIHKANHEPIVRAAGASEVAVGDLMDGASLERAAAGVEAIYHICPNVHPHEIRIGEGMVRAALRKSVPRFVFHSVLRPQIEAMAHHWRKMRVEEMLWASDLEVTVLQPGALMQNLLAHWPRMRDEGVLPVPYSPAAKLTLLDLPDVAEVAAKVLVEPGHGGATYELCGSQDLDHREMAEIAGQILGRHIEVRPSTAEAWRKKASAALDEASLEALAAMFRYYDRHGFCGNGKVLEMLLGRPPTTLQESLAAFAAGSNR